VNIVRTGAHDVLMVVDVQRDFCRGGALAVPDGDAVVPVINRVVPFFGRWVYTRDWHPHDHTSFSADPQFRDGSWPPHAPMNAILVSKGDDRDLEEYSGFPAQRLDLAGFLKLRKVERVFVTGLATDYCVRETAMDACIAGFTVYVIEDATRGVSPDTTAAAWAEMEAAGVVRITSDQLEDSGERPAAAYDEHGNPVHHEH
jgi:nicotinamidase/pyrazinamidase